ncbi:hypothetical protein PLESTB_000605100 [Pleodorina starrii]|uniref:Sodium/calcium exchanger membrane region domain-containing protein n=1 Tax=Pleodorina starrii TaxID=330485 RepID=A0A9W6BHG2_9CHLO|nr:hypothetical protein PLESTM_000426400 [Pleodorina starrii]GLC52286.1 hypothetical protein PLESTB_000605100 [Pleodorina starrii]GLC76091.1 hypothetical protein PLESTF_001733500 [Pleodorina starrii]
MTDSRASEMSPPPLVRALSKGRSSSAMVEQAKAEARAFFLDSKLNILLVAMPLAFISRFTGWGDGATFALSCLALVPLAERLGFVTEQLAMYTNDTLGGLLNATFGNATEMIISAFAMIQARKTLRTDPASTTTYLRVVQLSLLGSVASNLLLVMGTAFIAGGVKTKAQTFSQTGINVNAGMLILSCFAIMLPSLLDATKSGASDNNKSELALSRFESVFMFLCYCVFLYFQLKTHRHLYEEDSSSANTPINTGATSTRRPSHSGGGGAFTPPLGGDVELATSGAVGAGAAAAAGAGNGNGNGLVVSLSRSSLDGRDITLDGRFASRPVERTTSGGRSSAKADRERDVERLPLVLAANRAEDEAPDDDDDSHRSAAKDDDDEEEELVLSKTGCFLWLTGVTIFISFLSEFVTDAIKGASTNLRIPMPFLTTILLPIVGNAAEHASAIVFAYKNRIEIALGVAVGSSTQVSMMVVPFCVLLAWTMGLPLDLDFNGFESFVLFGCVLLAVLVVQDGHANYLKGMLLLLTYFFVAAGFWCHKDAQLVVKE